VRLRKAGKRQAVGIHGRWAIRSIVLIHWDAPEAKLRVARLETWGYAATFENRAGPALLRAIRDQAPTAVVIDLSRLPAQGRDVAVALRLNAATRGLPIVFVDGLPEKVLVVRETLPDATYSTWTHLAEDLPRAIERPPRKPVVPESALAGYAGKSLLDKLGLKPDSVVALMNAPSDFASKLEPLPKNVTLRGQMGPDVELVLWFVKSRRDLQDGLTLRAARLGSSRLWVLWPKKTSGQSGDISQAVVRELGLAQGLVDYKIASIDATWSGLLFVRRKP
jgi:CheY-like chemotaxis protein